VLVVKLLIGTPWVVMTTALCAFLGHVYPVFFKFKGGKGVATYIGCLFGGYFWLGTAAGGIWLVIAAITRYSSLSALVMAAIMPLLVWIVLGFKAFLPLLIMSGILFYRHKKNIERLRLGTEPKIGK
jgi:glycerol-3-phosphate acyltransferase PlsY